MGERVRRGGILHYVLGSQRLRVVVVTADRYNPEKALIAPLRERPGPALLPAFLVPLTKQDWPTAAFVDLSAMRPLSVDAVTGMAGQLSRPSTANLALAVRTYMGPGE